MNNLNSNFLEDLDDLENSVVEENWGSEEIEQEEERENQLQKQQSLEVRNLGSNLINDDKFRMHLEQIETQSSDKLIAQSNEYIVQIEKEIQIMHQQLRDIYVQKFVELEQLVQNPIDYARCVQLIKNENNITNIDLSGILQNNQLVALTISFEQQQFKQKQLETEQVKECTNLCNQILELDDKKQKLLKFQESKMEIIAPNVNRLVGSRVAAQLIAAVGCLDKLANTPACNILVLGNSQSRKNQLGLKVQRDE